VVVWVAGARAGAGAAVCFRVRFGARAEDAAGADGLVGLVLGLLLVRPLVR